MPKVLIIDDSKFIQNWCHKVLHSKGIQVDVCGDGHEAIEKIPSVLPQLIILDLMMPKMDGYQTLQHLRSHKNDIPIVVISTQPVAQAEAEVKRLGAQAYLQKPFEAESFLKIVNQFISKANIDEAPPPINQEYLESPADQPWEILMKACYVCGYDQVRVFCSKKNAFEENWNAGIFPHYIPIGKYTEWDFFRTKVSVCPSCLFASKNAHDFADRGQSLNYPYKIDAKKILASGMGGRRKLIATDLEAKEDHRFDHHMRNLEIVLHSLRLAEKCANGLILGDKKSAYADLGFYSLMIAVLDKTKAEQKAREALQAYYDQLKVKEIPRELTVMCYYFVITLHIALGESIKANEQKIILEGIYRYFDPDEAGAEERLWNQRLVHVWRNGAEMSRTRELY
jgi:CheY-like chemotaxis protein